MNYKVEDFVFDHIEPLHQDIWFKVTGETKKNLTQKYQQQSMIEVSEAVCSIEDGAWAIKLLFPFNYVMVTPDDDELLSTLKEAAMRDKYIMQKEELP